MDIYLSARALNKVREAGIGAGIKIVYALLASVAGISSMGIAWGVLMILLRKITTLVVDQTFRAYKAGRVYKIRHWKYAGWRYQH